MSLNMESAPNTNVREELDPLFFALSCFRRRKFEMCAETCTGLLEKNPYDQAVWTLKMRSLTEQVYVDEADNDEEGIAEIVLDDNAIARVARPGTSLKTPSTSQGMPSQAFRPMSASGRPLSGVIRPGTQSGRPGTMEGALRTARTARTARPATSATGRHVRLGTASMLSTPDGPFIAVGRLNISKYAAERGIARSLFEYLFHHENDVRNALHLASLATQASNYRDWWWKVQLGKCYFRLGLYRDAEQQFRSVLLRHAQSTVVDIYLYLSKVYIKLDQPLTAIDIYKNGLEKYPGEVTLLTNIARIYEGLNDATNSLKYYKDVLDFDNTHIEAIACIGSHHFYTDQPELSLRFYRRLLHMGVYGCEIYVNLGLCCFYAQQYDMIFSCLSRAIQLAQDDETLADVWYNISHIALGLGDTSLAYQCLRLTLASNNNHAEAFNNLGVLEMRRGRQEQAMAFFSAAASIGSHLYEPHYNTATLSEQRGDLQTSHNSITKCLQVYPEHSQSRRLLDKLERQFSLL